MRQHDVRSGSGSCAALLVGLALTAAHAYKPSQWACMPPNNAFPFCNASLSIHDRVMNILALMDNATKVNNAYTSAGPTGGSSALHIPSIEWWAENTHGPTNRHGYATTMFPMPSLTSCAWNMSLVREIYALTGREGRAASNLGYNSFTFWAPNINLVIDPRWGRAQEVMGEDPTFTAQWAVQHVLGMQQGDSNSSTGGGGVGGAFVQVAATLKHYTVYAYEGYRGSPESRLSFNANVSEGDMLDTYNVPFQAAIQDGGALGVMCSYSAVNATPMCANAYLLRDVLRGSWNFSGYITGDCNAVQDIGHCSSSSGCHNYTSTNSSTVRAALLGGTTLDCGTAFQRWLPGALSDGSVTPAMLDDAVYRQLAVRMRTGAFDSPDSQPFALLGNESVCTPAAQQLSQRAAEEAAVLLKNMPPAAGGLPLARAAIISLALVGPNANDTAMQWCSYEPTPCGGFGAMVSPLAALQAFSTVRYAQGCDAGCAHSTDFPAAVAAAAASDATVLAVGLNCQLAGESQDRTSLALPGLQAQLIAVVCAAAAPKPCIVVINAGASVDVSAALSDANVTAVLFAGYGGPYAGPALARVLFGEAGGSPAGRLTTSWYLAAYADEVDARDMSMRPGVSVYPPYWSPGRTHRHYTGPNTLFPFGYGLSYTTFEYGALSGPSVVHAAAAVRDYLGGAARVSHRHAIGLPLASAPVARFVVDVTNTGRLNADEVVLAFLVPPGAGRDGVPLQELVGFQRVHVRAGNVARVAFDVHARDLTLAASDGGRAVLLGVYELRVGVKLPPAQGGTGARLASVAFASTTFELLE